MTKYFFLLILVLPLPALAYLDPGSISLALQGFLAALAGLGATFGLWKNKVVGLFSTKQKKRNKDNIGKPHSTDSTDETPPSA